MHRPAPSAAIFITLIVKAPIIPIINAVVALFILSVENPLPALKSLSIRRSLIFKVVLLVFQAFLSILYYQVRIFSPGHSEALADGNFAGDERGAVVIDSDLLLPARHGAWRND